MSHVRLIVSIIFLGLALSHNLLAGPIYAAKWKKDDQTVLLYGDQHNTHEQNEVKECEAINAFSRELTSMKTETLVLYEDLGSLSNIFDPHSLKQLFCKYDKSFIYCMCQVVQDLSDQIRSNLRKESIDPRRELRNLLSYALVSHDKELSKKLYPFIQQQEIIFHHAYEKVKDGNIAGAFERLITQVEFFAEFTHDKEAEKIFSEIASTLKIRKKLLWRKIVADTGLSKQELNQATIKMLVTLMSTDSRYAKLVHFLVNPDLTLYYSLETVEADALWHITQASNTCDNIVVVAGMGHTYNLEKFLLQLGFEQCFVAGQEHMNAFEKKKMAECYLNSLLDVKHQERVYPLDPLDLFGQVLYMDVPNLAAEAAVNSSVSEELSQAFQDFMVKKAVLESFNPVPLVPFETFKWINEA